MSKLNWIADRILDIVAWVDEKRKGGQSCMCGARDCPKCYPGCNYSPDCVECGEKFYPDDYEQDTCDGCLEESSVWCIKCGDEHPALGEDDDDFVCDDCKDRDNE